MDWEPHPGTSPAPTAGEGSPAGSPDVFPSPPSTTADAHTPFFDPRVTSITSSSCSPSFSPTSVFPSSASSSSPSSSSFSPSTPSPQRPTPSLVLFSQLSTPHSSASSLTFRQRPSPTQCKITSALAEEYPVSTPLGGRPLASHPCDIPRAYSTRSASEPAHWISTQCQGATQCHSSFLYLPSSSSHTASTHRSNEKATWSPPGPTYGNEKLTWSVPAFRECTDANSWDQDFVPTKSRPPTQTSMDQPPSLPSHSLSLRRGSARPAFSDSFPLVKDPSCSTASQALLGISTGSRMLGSRGEQVRLPRTQGAASYHKDNDMSVTSRTFSPMSHAATPSSPAATPSSPAEVVHDVEMRVLESKLELLKMQRQLSAIKCQNFLDTLENHRRNASSRRRSFDMVLSANKRKWPRSGQPPDLKRHSFSVSSPVVSTVVSTVMTPADADQPSGDEPIECWD